MNTSKQNIVNNVFGKSIGISMPVLNEAKCIELTISEIITELDGKQYTLCIIDGGSTDGTLDIINRIAGNNNIKLIVSKKTRAGCQRGAASRMALEWLVCNTDHDIFVEIDADGAQRPSELLSGIRAVSGSKYDIAIASKYIPGSKIIGRSVIRNFISIFYSMLARVLIHSGLNDYSNSYRFYNRKAAEFLLLFKPKYTNPIYLFEILLIWIANGFSIIEIPTIYNATNDTKSKVTALDVIRGLFGLLEVSFRFHIGALNVKKYGL